MTFMTFLSFMEKVLKLKELKRTGWLVRNIKDAESVASHSFNVALLCVLFSEDQNLDVRKCIELALLHDLHEAECGDLISKEYCLLGLDAREKLKRELEAAESMLAAFPEKKEKLAKLFELFERKTKEAIFVKDMDILETCLQALYYVKHGKLANASDFFSNAEAKLSKATAKRLFKEMKACLANF